MKRQRNRWNWNTMLVVIGLASLMGCQAIGPKQQTEQPGELSSSPTSMSFGNVQMGTSQTQGGSVTNIGTSDITVTQVAVSGAGYSASGITAPLTLAGGQSASFSVVFAPKSAGSVSGSVALTTANGTVSVALSGSGVAEGDLSPSPTSVAFGNVVVGDVAPQPETITNTGGSDLTVTAATVTGAGFSYSGLSLPLTLAANQSSTFSVNFTPPGAGSSSGKLSLTVSGSSTTVDIALSGNGVTPGILSANPTSVGFGDVQDGSSKSLSETLSNTGGSSLTISAASASGTGFSLSGLTLPLTLTAGQSTSFNVVFAPTASGAASGSVTITSNGSDSSLSIALSGTGVTQGTLTANPTSLAFGNVQVSNSVNLSETLTNVGGSSVSISQANLSGAGFSISGLSGFPITLTPGGSITFTATFTPASAGAASGSLSVVSNASNSPLTIALSGTGTASGTLAVSPASLSFGNVVVGTSSALSASLIASGASVTV